MNILCIGNSFSVDATRYLHQIARSNGTALNVSVLYIGGCPLSRHFKNMHTKEHAYELYFNGFGTGHFVGLEEMLLIRHDWDYITVQQASPISTKYDTYQPYLNELVAYVRRLAPKAKIVMHETWAYEENSARLLTMMGYEQRSDMYFDLHDAYTHAAADIAADLYIPSGTLFEELAKMGMPLHRDTYHASRGVGRYALGLLWYAKLTGKDIDGIYYNDFDEPIEPSDAEIVKNCVKSILTKTIKW